MVVISKLEIPESDLNRFCKKHAVRRLALFGSVLRDDFSDESDIDVLVEFEDNKTPGLDFFSIEEELSMILGKKVDLNTEAFLSPHFREEVKKEARNIYVQN